MPKTPKTLTPKTQDEPYEVPLGSPKRFLNAYVTVVPYAPRCPKGWDVGTFEEFVKMMVSFVGGGLECTPWHSGPLVDEHAKADSSMLVEVIESGFVTIDGHEGVVHDVAPRTLTLHGPLRHILPLKGTDYAHTRQAPYIEGFCLKENAKQVYDMMTARGYCVVAKDSSETLVHGNCSGCVQMTQEVCTRSEGEPPAWPSSELREGFHEQLPWDDELLEDFPKLQKMLGSDCVLFVISSKTYGPSPLLRDLVGAMRSSSSTSSIFPSAADAAAPDV